MRKQQYPIAQLTGGLDISVDPVFLLDKSSPKVQNIRLYKSIIEKGLGWKQFSPTSSPNGLPLSGTVLLIDTFPLSSGSINYLMVTEDYVYLYDSSTQLYTKKNQLDGGSPKAFTGTPDHCFCSTICVSAGGYEWFLLTNGIDYIQYWDGDNPASSRFDDLAGWTDSLIKAKSIIYYKNRLIAGGTVENGTNCPKRIRWSVAGNVTTISGTGSGFFDLVDTDDWITGFAVIKDKLFVIKERSIWELEYVGGTSIFNPVIKADGVGSFSPNSIISLDEEILFYGSDNIYTCDGLGNLTPIGGQIYPYLYEARERIVNGTVANRFQAAYIEELKQYMLCVASYQSQVPNLIFYYDFDYNAWTVRNKEITAIGYYGVDSGDTWNELSGNWNSQTWIWMDVDLAPGAPTTLIGDSHGNIYEDDRLTTSTDYMCYVTKDFLFTYAVRWVEFRMNIVGGPFTVCYSIDSGTTWSSRKSFGSSTNWTEYVWFLNFTSQRIRFMIECSAADLKIKWLEPWFIPRARSKVLRSS